MKYTIEDLRGRYVKTGTPEAEVFLDACEELGVLWRQGEKPREYMTGLGYITILNCAGDIRGASHEWLEKKGLKPFTIKPKWSIYTNTLPLSELTDEQAGQLFNAWRKGLGLQTKFGDGWGCSDYGIALLRKDVCRIKQKSEREQFVDAMMAGCSFDNSHAKTVRSVVEQIYDSGKVKLVKDGA